MAVQGANPEKPFPVPEGCGFFYLYIILRSLIFPPFRDGEGKMAVLRLNFSILKWSLSNE